MYGKRQTICAPSIIIRTFPLYQTIHMEGQIADICRIAPVHFLVIERTVPVR